MFDYDLDFEAIDFRKRPELYRIGKGEQGVLLVRPYKGEILHRTRSRAEDDGGPGESPARRPVNLAN